MSQGNSKHHQHAINAFLFKTHDSSASKDISIRHATAMPARHSMTQPDNQ